MDKKNIKELIEYILESIDLIEERFGAVKTRDAFLHDHFGLEKLDAISMRLQSVGESIKNILKQNPTVLLQYEDKSYWSNIVKFREIISHHYIDINSELVYDICEDDLRDLKQIIGKILKEI